MVVPALQGGHPAVQLPRAGQNSLPTSSGCHRGRECHVAGAKGVRTPSRGVRDECAWGSLAFLTSTSSQLSFKEKNIRGKGCLCWAQQIQLLMNAWRGIFMKYSCITMCKYMQLNLKAIPKSFFQAPQYRMFRTKHLVCVSANKLRNWLICPAWQIQGSPWSPSSLRDVLRPSYLAGRDLHKWIFNSLLPQLNLIGIWHLIPEIILVKLVDD